MKRFLTVMMAAMAIVAAVSSCQKEDRAEVLDGPSLTWASNPEFGTVDITDGMDVVISVSAPAGISSFIVKIDSDVLNQAPLNLTELDLVNPGDYASMIEMILGEGVKVEGATSLDLDLSSLVPLINGLTKEDSYHSFTVEVTDSNSKSVSKTCTFHRVAEYDAPSIVWEGNETFAPVEIEQEMSVRLTITVPAGVSSFIVKIDSDVLNQAPLNLTELDLVNPGDYASIVDVILGTQDILTATRLDIDLSELVPMILLLNPAKDSDHTFTLLLEDKAGKTLEQACVFHYAGMA